MPPRPRLMPSFSLFPPMPPLDLFEGDHGPPEALSLPEPPVSFLVEVTEDRSLVYIPINRGHEAAPLALLQIPSDKRKLIAHGTFSSPHPLKWQSPSAEMYSAPGENSIVATRISTFFSPLGVFDEGWGDQHWTAMGPNLAATLYWPWVLRYDPEGLSMKDFREKFEARWGPIDSFVQSNPV